MARFRIYLENGDSDVLFFDTNNLDSYYCSSMKWKGEVGKSGSIECKIYPDNPAYSSFQQMTSYIYMKDEDGNILFKGRALDIDISMYKEKTVFFEGALGYLNDSYIEKLAKKDGKETVTAFFTRCINAHNACMPSEKKLYAGNVTISEKDKEVEFEISSISNVLAVLEDKLVNEYGGYLHARYESGKCYVDYLSKFPKNTWKIGQEVKFTVNITDLSQKAEGEDIFTAFIPIGKDNTTISSVNDGQIWIAADNDAISKYGKIFKIESFSDISDASALKTKAQSYCSDNYVADMNSIEVKAIDMHFIDGDQDSIRVGSCVKIASSTHGVAMWRTCKAMEVDLLDPSQSTYTFEVVKQSSSSSSGGGTSTSGSSYGGTVSGESAWVKNLKNYIDADKQQLTLHADSISLLATNVAYLQSKAIAIAAGMIKLFGISNYDESKTAIEQLPTIVLEPEEGRITSSIVQLYGGEGWDPAGSESPTLTLNGVDGSVNAKLIRLYGEGWDPSSGAAPSITLDGLKGLVESKYLKTENLESAFSSLEHATYQTLHGNTFGVKTLELQGDEESPSQIFNVSNPIAAKNYTVASIDAFGTVDSSTKTRKFKYYSGGGDELGSFSFPDGSGVDEDDVKTIVSSNMGSYDVSFKSLETTTSLSAGDLKGSSYVILANGNVTATGGGMFGPIGGDKVIIGDDGSISAKSITIDSNAVATEAFVTGKNYTNEAAVKTIVSSGMKSNDVEFAGITGSSAIFGSLTGNYVQCNMGSLTASTMLMAPEIKIRLSSTTSKSVKDGIAAIQNGVEQSGKIVCTYTTLGGGDGSFSFNIADTQTYKNALSALATQSYFPEVQSGNASFKVKLPVLESTTGVVSVIERTYSFANSGKNVVISTGGSSWMTYDASGIYTSGWTSAYGDCVIPQSSSTTATGITAKWPGATSDDDPINRTYSLAINVSSTKANNYIDLKTANASGTEITVARISAQNCYGEGYTSGWTSAYGDCVIPQSSSTTATGITAKWPGATSDDDPINRTYSLAINVSSTKANNYIDLKTANASGTEITVARISAQNCYGEGYTSGHTDGWGDAYLKCTVPTTIATASSITVKWPGSTSTAVQNSRDYTLSYSSTDGKTYLQTVVGSNTVNVAEITAGGSYNSGWTAAVAENVIPHDTPETYSNARTFKWPTATVDGGADTYYVKLYETATSAQANCYAYMQIKGPGDSSYINIARIPTSNTWQMGYQKGVAESDYSTGWTAARGKTKLVYDSSSLTTSIKITRASGTAGASDPVTFGTYTMYELYGSAKAASKVYLRDASNVNIAVISTQDTWQKGYNTGVAEGGYSDGWADARALTSIARGEKTKEEGDTMLIYRASSTVGATAPAVMYTCVMKSVVNGESSYATLYYTNSSGTELQCAKISTSSVWETAYEAGYEDGWKAAHDASKFPVEYSSSKAPGSTFTVTIPAETKNNTLTYTYTLATSSSIYAIARRASGDKNWISRYAIGS